MIDDTRFESEQYFRGTRNRRTSRPVPETLLCTLASLHKDSARKLYYGGQKGELYVTGLGVKGS
eukprot:5554577-Amphidinium_carterae.1